MSGWRMLGFAFVTTVVWSMGNGYVAWRLLGPLRLTGGKRVVAWGVASLLILFVPAGMFLGRAFGHTEGVCTVTWAAFLDMGFLVILLPLVATRDIAWMGLSVVRRVGRRFAQHRSAGAATPSDLVEPERRLFLLNATNAALVGLTGTLAGIGIRDAVRIPRTVRVDVPIPNLPAAFDGYRILQLSDIHVGPTIRRPFTEALVAACAPLAPDLVAITGDLVDGEVEDLRPHVAPLGNLRAKDGVFFVTGNHEYYSGVEAWCDECSRLGWQVLNNRHVVIERGQAWLVIAGVTDRSAGRHLASHVSDPRAALRGAPADALRILLAHQPTSVIDASKTGVDFQLSGHTHGGQIFPWTLLVGFVHGFSPGLTRVGRTALYVSRGAGYWGPPMRVGAPSEITLLTLRADSKPATPAIARAILG